MTKTDGNAIMTMIDAETSFDTSTVVFHRDGRISAVRDADKVPGASSDRLLVAYANEFANGANPL